MVVFEADVELSIKRLPRAAILCVINSASELPTALQTGNGGRALDRRE